MTMNQNTWLHKPGCALLRQNIAFSLSLFLFSKLLYLSLVETVGNYVILKRECKFALKHI